MVEFCVCLVFSFVCVFVYVGCMSMFRASTIASDEFHSQVIKKFAARPDKSSLISHICKEKGEDRWLTLLLLELCSKMTPRGTVVDFC